MLHARIAQEFPAYEQLVNPSPVTVDQVRGTLRSGEAVLATYVTPERTFVWAIPQSGPVAYAVVPAGEKALADAVAELRRSLDPSATTWATFRPSTSSALTNCTGYCWSRVSPAGRRAASLYVVARADPIGVLPFGLLVTDDATVSSDDGALFSSYRKVPWLIRTHAAQCWLVADPSRARARRPRPDVRERQDLRGHEAPVVLRALGQQEPIERGRVGDRDPQAVARGGQFLTHDTVALLEDVGHGGAEDAAALTGVLGSAIPAEWLVPVLVTEEAARCFGAPEPWPGAGGEVASVTVIACRRDLDAAPPGVEGRVGP